MLNRAFAQLEAAFAEQARFTSDAAHELRTPVSVIMAKDVTGAGALNDFNLHYDPQRGWHYHVTPGKFPYLIGGYWGTVERWNMCPPRGRGPLEPEGPPPGPPPL